MNAFLSWLVQNAATTALLIPLVMVLCRWIPHRPALQHLLWLVIMLKMVTPPIVTIPIPYLRMEPPQPPQPDWVALNQPANVLMPVEPKPRLALTHNADPMWDLAYILVNGLGIGASVYLSWQLRLIRRHRAIVQRTCDPSAEFQAEIDSLSHRMRVRSPQARLAVGIASPFIWCLGRVRLIWPQSLPVQRAQGILAHELAHIQRRDHWIAWLVLLAGIVWWWNPLFWLVRRRLQETAEMACDALALNVFPEGRRDYAELLLELSLGFVEGAPTPALGVRAGSPSSFERRLSMILSDRVSARPSLFGTLVVLGFSLIILPGWTFAQIEPTASAPQVTKEQEPEKREKDNIPVPVEAFSDLQRNAMFPNMIILQSNLLCSRLGIDTKTPEPALANQLQLPEGKGLVITNVKSKSSAEKAGLHKHDVLLEFAGIPVSNQPLQFLKEMQSIKADTEVTAVIVRQGQKQTIQKIKLPEFKSENPLGMPIVVDSQFVPFPITTMNAIGGTFANAQATGNGEAIGVSINNNEFKIEMSTSKKRILIKGIRQNNQSIPNSIEIQDGNTKIHAQSLEQIPELHRATVEKLLKNVK